MAFSPDGKRVLTGSWDSTARLWDAITGRPLGPAFSHRDLVVSAIFGADGNIWTASRDGSVRRWQTPKPLIGEVRRMVLWTQVLTGMELDAEGVVRDLDARTWAERRERLEQMGGPPAP